jgi:hypothetical protein
MQVILSAESETFGCPSTPERANADQRVQNRERNESREVARGSVKNWRTGADLFGTGDEK